MRLSILVPSVIVFSSAIFQPCTNDGLDIEKVDDVSSLTSAEINLISDPKLKSKVMKGEQKISEMKAQLCRTISKSLFSSFGCAIGSMRYDLEFAYRYKLDDGSKGYGVGGQPLDRSDLREQYPKSTNLNGVSLLVTQFPDYTDQEKLARYFQRWFKFLRQNQTSAFAATVRGELKKLCETENRKLDDEAYREFAFVLSRSYVLICQVTRKILGHILQAHTDRRANETEEITFEEWLDKKTPGGWFFPKRQLTYLNVLRRCRGIKDGDYLGLEVDTHHVIPYSGQDECPHILQSNLVQVLPPSLRKYIPRIP